MLFLTSMNKNFSHHFIECQISTNVMTRRQEVLNASFKGKRTPGILRVYYMITLPIVTSSFAIASILSIFPCSRMWHAIWKKAMKGPYKRRIITAFTKLASSILHLIPLWSQQYFSSLFGYNIWWLKNIQVISANAWPYPGFPLFSQIFM